MLALSSVAEAYHIALVAVTSAFSAQLIAVSSIVTYDIYQYVPPYRPILAT